MLKLRRGKKIILIIAGPNGAGKTTFAERFIKIKGRDIRFLNADRIANNISPGAPEAAALEAGKIILQEIDFMVARGDDFAFETTLSGRSYSRHIRRWQAQGYHVELVFLVVDSVKACIARVKGRVAQRGHNIPEGVIRRRYNLGLRNFEQLYKPIVDSWSIYDNSASEPVLRQSSHAVKKD